MEGTNKMKNTIPDNRLIRNYWTDSSDFIELTRQIHELFTIIYPDLKVVATGSSSFELANQISEPLTGRT